MRRIQLIFSIIMNLIVLSSCYNMVQTENSFSIEETTMSKEQENFEYISSEDTIVSGAKWYISEIKAEEILENGENRVQTLKYLSDGQCIFNSTQRLGLGLAELESFEEKVLDENNKLLSVKTLEYTIYFSYTENEEQSIGISSTYQSNNSLNECYRKVVYNQSKQLILDETYCNNKVNSSSYYTYHENGNIKTKDESFADFRDITTYDQNQNIILTESFINETLVMRATYTYKNNRFESYEITLFEYGNGTDNVIELTNRETVIEQDENWVKSVYYDASGKIEGYNVSFYNEQNNLCKFVSYDSLENEISRVTYMWKQETE